MDLETLKELARYQRWADAEHWKALHENAGLLEDAEIKQRLNHMVNASEMLMTLSRGEIPDMESFKKERGSAEELDSAMTKASDGIDSVLSSADLTKKIKMPRGPQGPFEAEVGALVLQAIEHRQHHRAQNATRMHALGTKPPMIDYIIWYALGRP